MPRRCGGDSEEVLESTARFDDSVKPHILNSLTSQSIIDVY